MIVALKKKTRRNTSNIYQKLFTNKNDELNEMLEETTGVNRREQLHQENEELRDSISQHDSELLDMLNEAGSERTKSNLDYYHKYLKNSNSKRNF